MTNTNQLIADFTDKVNSLEASDLRVAYTQLWNLEGCPGQLLDIALSRLIDLVGVESAEAFVDTLA